MNLFFITQLSTHLLVEKPSLESNAVSDNINLFKNDEKCFFLVVGK